MWRNNIIDITQRQNKANANLHLCEAQPCSIGDLALSSAFGLSAPRPETYWAHLTISAYSCHIWAEKTACVWERDTDREKESLHSPSLWILVYPLPPIPLWFLTLTCLFAEIPALSYHLLCPSFSFSPTLWGGQELEEGWRQGQVARKKEGRKKNNNDEH